VIHMLLDFSVANYRCFAEEAVSAATALHERGIPRVLVTLGGNGAVRASDEGAVHVPAIDLGPVVDTTGAGDAAVGVLAAALAAGHDFPDAVNEGMRAGSTAVLSAGAAASYAGIAPVAPRS
ncbi:MAG: PfkB family carbohydrate kinase, partial [Actinomyces dentalis]